MHAPPAFRITVRHFGVWRAWVLCLGLASLAAGTAWALSLPSWGARCGGAALLVGWVAALKATWGLRPFRLKWDTQCWWLEGVARPAAGPLMGQLAVALDFGGWMLLRFVPARDPGAKALIAGSRASHWLPVQRRGHEPAWHAFRCTVHADLPAQAGEPAAHGR